MQGDSNHAPLNQDAHAPGSAQRLYLTVLFADLSESTRLAASMETEHFADLHSALRIAYEEAIQKHGGTIVSIQGDGLLAIFGHPMPSEADARSATEAALELHALVRNGRFSANLRSPVPLNLHSGIHSGLVLVGAGDTVRGRFSLTGNALNIAARMSNLAERDEILVSAETLGPEKELFLTGELKRLTVRGVDEPIPTYRILGRAPIQTRFQAVTRRGLTPFVGRQSELQALEECLLECADGRFQFSAISAQAGVGKTRLAEEVMRRAHDRDYDIHRGYCDNLLSAEPLQPFLQILRTLFCIDHNELLADATQLVLARIAQMDTSIHRYQDELLALLSLTKNRSTPSVETTIEALLALFGYLSTQHPVAIFVDDWQWADDATRQVVGALCTRATSRCFLLIATRGFAAGDANMNDAKVLDLAPLSHDETTATIARLLPGTDPFLVGEVRKHSGGNPLFIEELCHSITQHVFEHHVDTLRDDAWLDRLIAARVARLSPSHIELVRAAATVGNVIPMWLLTQISGCTGDDPLLDELARQDLLFKGEKAGTLRFKHGITRDAVYKAIGLNDRQALHLRIAAALREYATVASEEEWYEALAYHYGAGGEATETVRYAELAGNKAMTASALDRAQAQYRAALRAIDQLPCSDANEVRWLEIAQRLGLACVFDPSREAIPILNRAVERAVAYGNASLVARAEYWFGYLHDGLGESQITIRHCERALIAAQSVNDDRLIVQIRATLGQALVATCKYDRATALLDEAIAVKRRHRSGSRPAVGMSYSLTCKAASLADRGQFGAAHECFDEAVEIVKGAHHEVEGSVFSRRSAVYLWQGRFDEARECALYTQQVAERVRSFYLFAMGRALAAYSTLAVAQDAEALQTLLDATSWLQARGCGQFISLNYGWLTDSLVNVGNVQCAREKAARAMLRSRKGDLLGGAMTCRALARASLQTHQLDRATHYLDQAIHIAEARRSPHEHALNAMCRAEIATERGEHGEAMNELESAYRSFDSMSMPWHLDQVMQLKNKA